MRKKKGQAAIEFLTTYGWAMMAIALAIGALLYFDVLDSDRYVREECDTGNQIQCLELYVNDNGILRMRVINNYAVGISAILEVSGDASGASGSETIGPAEEDSITINNLAGTYSEGDALNLDFIIKYARSGQPLNYELRGSGSTRVVAAPQQSPPPSKYPILT